MSMFAMPRRNLHSVHHSLHPPTIITPIEAIRRLTAIRADLILLEASLHAADLITERDHAEDAAEHCDYALDTLKLLASGGDGL